MNGNDPVPSYLHDRNYLDLVAYYVDHPIALYAGAGVSWSDDPKFGVGLWNDFVRRILLCNQAISPETVEDFDRNISRWKDQPWEMAEWVADKLGCETFKQSIMTLVQGGTNFQKEYKLLSGKFVENAKTLNAVVAFCAGFSAGKLAQERNGQWMAVYQRSINQRVRAIITSNYDPFLEAASSTMFRKPILKPVAARGSSVGALTEIPVFHIHGYVPFPHKFRNEEQTKHIPIVDPVITTSDYESAWKADNVYNFTMGPQIHILRHYAVLFIGFSFRDRWVNNLLSTLNEERRPREDRLYHYAILKKDVIGTKGPDYFEKELGVKPIPIDDFSQIKDLLGSLYQRGLIQDHHGCRRIKLPQYEGRHKSKQDKPVALTPEEYFEELYNCRLSMVRAGRL